MKLHNDRFLKALRREPVDCTPVWIMRQAGRYLPEYRASREKAGSFLNLCQTPELACEVTLQPLRRFDLDAAILFSDILTVPNAMGLPLSFETGEGPKFHQTISQLSDVNALKRPDPEGELRYVMDAVRLIKRELHGKVPLIGFAGSPWTLATYMIEGGGSKEFAKAKAMLYNAPEVLHALLSRLAESVTEYLLGQIKAGVDAVMVFDTWGGVLTPDTYRLFSLAYMQKIVAAIKPTGVPIILFTKGGGPWLESMAETGCHALGVDWTVNIGTARERVGHKVALQGNLDPGVLYAKPVVIEREVERILGEFGTGSGHVFNLGHGIHPGIHPEHVAALVEAVHAKSRPYHL
jgi:uroporphyrinogen decarboxylase